MCSFVLVSFLQSVISLEFDGTQPCFNLLFIYSIRLNSFRVNIVTHRVLAHQFSTYLPSSSPFRHRKVVANKLYTDAVASVYNLLAVTVCRARHQGLCGLDTHL